MAISILNNFTEGVQALLDKASAELIIVGHPSVSPIFLDLMKTAKENGLTVTFITQAASIGVLEHLGIEVYRYPPLHLSAADHFAVADLNFAVFNEAFLGGDSTPGNYLLASRAEYPEILADLLDRFSSLKETCHPPDPPDGENRIMRDPFVLFYQEKIALLLLQEEELEEKKTDIELTILHFEQRVLRQLGPLLLEKLEWQKKVAEFYLKIELTPENIGKAQKAGQDYFEAQQNFQLEQKARQRVLDTREENELKELYKAAIKKVHPDKFPNDTGNRAEAEKIAAELNAAYRSKDLERVRAIHEKIERGQVYQELQTVSDREQLERIYYETKICCENLVNQIRQIKSSQIYNLVKQYWPNYMDEYFDLLEPMLRAELNELKTVFESLREQYHERD